MAISSHKSGALKRLALAGLLLVSTGCAASGSRLDYDPLEGMNRKIFAFNDALDVHVIEPVAKGYRWLLPDPVERAITRFFRNLGFPIRLVNNLLQGEFADSGEETLRFVANTTVGIGGLFDPAASWGLEAHPEDFGQTLGTWGVSPGPYLVLPLLGPSNFRDGVGLVVDTYTAVTPFVFESETVWALYAINFVSVRANLIVPIENAKAASIDYYTFVRNAYSQLRMEEIEEREDSGDDEAGDLYDDSLYDEDLYDDELNDLEDSDESP